MKSHTKMHLIAIAAASALTAGLAHADGADKIAPTNIDYDKLSNAAPTAAHAATTPRTVPTAGDREMAAWQADADALERMLLTVSTRDGYAQALRDAGYRIAAINSDDADYLEYEVVKGNHTFEVQLDFENNAGRATAIDVAANLWRADATERMIDDPGYAMTAPLAADPTGRYSDRRYMAAWNEEKSRLEQALPVGLPLARYPQAIEQMGYRITTVNERDPVEYEVVKGDNSYEVDIAFDPASRLASNVDVWSDLWDADATERAKDSGEKVSLQR